MPGEVKMKPCPFCGREPHISKDAPFFSVSCSCGKTAKTSLKKAIESWNRRALEPGTSVIRWTRYDGTPETRPVYDKRVLLVRKGWSRNRPRISFITMLSGGGLEWVFTDRGYAKTSIGDLWTYLPDPPEGME